MSLDKLLLLQGPPRLLGIVKPKHTNVSMWNEYGEMSTVQNRCYPFFILLTAYILGHIFRSICEVNEM